MSVTAFQDLPLADRDREWDGDAAEKRVRAEVPILLVTGLAGFLVQPPVRSWRISDDAQRHGLWGALRSPGIRTLVLCTLPMGFCFEYCERKFRLANCGSVR